MNGTSLYRQGSPAKESPLSGCYGCAIAAMVAGSPSSWQVTGMIAVANGLPATALVTALLAGRGDGWWNGVPQCIPRTVGWLDNGDGSVAAACAAPGDTNIDLSVDILDAAHFLSTGLFDAGSSNSVSGFIAAMPEPKLLGLGGRAHWRSRLDGGEADARALRAGEPQVPRVAALVTLGLSCHPRRAWGRRDSGDTPSRSRRPA
jgi:hypothetical protein